MSYRTLENICTPKTIAITDNNKYISLNSALYNAYEIQPQFYNNEYPGNDQFLNYVITQQPVYEKVQKVIKLHQ